MEHRGRTVEIHLIEGTPFGLRHVSIGNRTCQAFICPRASIDALTNHEEMKKAGVYFFITRDSTNLATPLVYIGEADHLANRLRVQIRNLDKITDKQEKLAKLSTPNFSRSHSDTDENKKKEQKLAENWFEVIAFIGDLDKTRVKYIEGQLIQKVKEIGQFEVVNKKDSSLKSISAATRSSANEFIDDIMFLIGVLGYRIFLKSDPQEDAQFPLLFIQSVKEGVLAQGKETNQGFTVYKGSHARMPKSQPYKQRLQELEKRGIVKEDTSSNRYIFSQDYTFDSPSAAAATILGRSSNGRTEWKTDTGKPLKELQR